MKKILSLLLTVVVGVCVFLPFINANAKEPVNVYLFYGEGCPYCEAAIEFFDSIEEKYGSKFDLIKYEVWYNSDNSALMKDVASKLNQTVKGVPFIVIGEQSFPGYAESYNEKILAAIDELYNSEDRFDVLEGETSNNDKLVVYIVLSVIIVSLVGLLAFTKAKAN